MESLSQMVKMSDWNIDVSNLMFRLCSLKHHVVLSKYLEGFWSL